MKEKSTLKGVANNYLTHTINQKGITLIALIVTIIIIIILAYVTISFVVDEDGIINKTKTAGNSYNKQQRNEALQLKKVENYIENIENVNNETISSLFVWNTSSININKLKSIVDYLNINTIYCNVNAYDFENFYFQRLAEFSFRENIKLFIITGSPEGLEDANVSQFNILINEIANYNKEHRNKIYGLSLDIEFYLSDEYINGTNNQKIELLSKFVDITKECYMNTMNNNLKLSLCIPTWLENLDRELLEDIIFNCCDYVQVMNYKKSSMIEDIEIEVEIAKKANKPIENIAELQAPNEEKGVTNDNTFYNDGIEACLQKFNEIKENYLYNKLGFSYHYYIPLKEMIANEVNIDNKYTLELYPYILGESIKIENAYLISNEEIKYGLSLKTEESNENILKFYYLDFDKEYRLIIEDERYKADMTYNYPYSSSEKQYYETLTINDLFKY